MKSSINLTRRHFMKTTTNWMLSGGALAMAKNITVPTPSKPWVVACRDTLLKAAKQPDSWSAMKELGVTGVEVEVNPELGCPFL